MVQHIDFFKIKERYQSNSEEKDLSFEKSHLGTVGYPHSKWLWPLPCTTSRNYWKWAIDPNTASEVKTSWEVNSQPWVRPVCFRGRKEIIEHKRKVTSKPEWARARCVFELSIAACFATSHWGCGGRGRWIQSFPGLVSSSVLQGGKLFKFHFWKTSYKDLTSKTHTQNVRNLVVRIKDPTKKWAKNVFKHFPQKWLYRSTESVEKCKSQPQRAANKSLCEC